MGEDEEAPTQPPTPQIPPPTFFDALSQLFSRRDKLLEYMAITDRQILDVLVAWATSQGVTLPPTVIVGAPPAIPPPVVLPPPAIPPTIVPGIPPEMRVIPKPTGPIVNQGSLATPTTTYQTVAKYTPTKDKRFQLTKIAVSCAEDIIVQLFWGGETITIPYYVMAKLPFTDWFPLDYHLVTHEQFLKGNGSTELLLKAKIPSGGTVAEVNAEIVGEES
jgi:hypothetical protein